MLLQRAHAAGTIDGMNMPVNAEASPAPSDAELFAQFTAVFEECLDNQLRKLPQAAGEAAAGNHSLDERIALLGRLDRKALDQAFTRTRLRTTGTRLPETRLGDQMYAFILFVRRHHRTPKDRMVFNDFLYKMKTTDEILDPLRVFVSDKEFLKVYVKAIVGDQYNVPTLDMIRTREEVRQRSFPPACCIKPTHVSGQAIIRTAGEAVDTGKIESWFDLNHYRIGREVNYKLLKPKVIVEPLIFDKENVEDFKIFCWQGVPKLIQVDVDRYIDHRRHLFDVRWNQQDYSIGEPRSNRNIPKPDNLAEMLALAGKLSAGFDFVRIDLYSDSRSCLVGEITNCHGNARHRFIPPSAELTASKTIFG